jgi:uncharacterized protein
MPEYLAPGVYVEEVSSGSKPIEGVSTSTAGFLGRTERGPADRAYLVTSFIEYQRRFGGFLNDPPAGSANTTPHFLPHAVKGFFDNGGRRAYISRTCNEDVGPAAASVGGIELEAIGPGIWGRNIFAILHQGKNPDLYNVTIAYFRKPPRKEDWVNLLVDPKVHRDSNLKDKVRPRPDFFESFDDLRGPDDVKTTLNSRSLLVRVKPFTGEIKLNPEKDVRDKAELAWIQLVVQIASDDRDNPTPANYQSSLRRLDEIDDISILVAPEHVDGNTALDNELIASCQRLADRVVLLSVADDTVAETTIAQHGGLDSSYAAFYHPWINVADPLSTGIFAKPKKIPAIGHIAGICARTDVTRGVHKAPANEVVIGAVDLPVLVNKGIQDVLNPRGVNCIRDFRADARGIRLWGARTISSDPEWKYLNVRRLFLFLEESIDQGTQWVVFEPNSDPTWAAVRRNITNFLTTVWRSGALQGSKPEEAFYVKCDYPTTMTQDDIDNGRLICVIGVAPVKPAEFVIIRISQKTLEAVA